MTVLIVDDDPVIRKILREILGGDDFPDMTVMEAEAGRQALKAVQQYRPALILMDIVLPDTNGLALTEEIIEMEPNTTVIVVTNNDTPEYREAAFESGATGFISKDSSLMDELNDVINRFGVS
jgi:DNA-binding NarL/FixJ family response regulator